MNLRCLKEQLRSSASLKQSMEMESSDKPGRIRQTNQRNLVKKKSRLYSRKAC